MLYHVTTPIMLGNHAPALYGSSIWSMACEHDDWPHGLDLRKAE